MHTLLTGFTTFGEHAANPSQLIVEALAERPDLTAVVLPVAYHAAGARIQELIQTHQPDAVVMLGLAASRPVIHLERFALNMDDARAPDNTGDLASGRPIVIDGPAAYTATLPLSALLATLETQQIPAQISNYAGTYVCNHVFYTARHTLEQMGQTVPCGFIHLPQITEVGGETGLPLATLIAAVECVLDALKLHAAEMNNP